MGVLERVSRAIAASDVAFDRYEVEHEARQRLAREAPWLGETATGEVVDRVFGFGPLQRLVGDSDVTDILVNGPSEVWVDRGAGLELTDVRFESAAGVVTTIERVIASTGLRIDRSVPMVAARLPDGSRLQAVLPPASVDSPVLAIRRFTQRVATLSQLVESGTATTEEVRILSDAVAEKMTIVVSGGTGAGKTTLLNLLASRIPPGERVVTIEDAAELSLPGHVVRLESRPANAEGAGQITIRDLLKSALRLRPDRIVIGEVRGQEALDLIWALNTGHRGSLTTVHANSPQEAMWRIETLALASGSASHAVVRQLYAAVDLVVQIERTPTGRRITAIADRDELKSAPT
jgi:pilus assembly protein CpaF